MQGKSSSSLLLNYLIIRILTNVVCYFLPSNAISHADRQETSVKVSSAPRTKYPLRHGQSIQSEFDPLLNPFLHVSDLVQQTTTVHLGHFVQDDA